MNNFLRISFWKLGSITLITLVLLSLLSCTGSGSGGSGAESTSGAILDAGSNNDQQSQASKELTALFNYLGISENSKLGGNVSPAGDYNLDGKVDILVSESLYTSDNKINRGRVQILSGSDQSQLHTFIGENAEDQFGFSISQIGDYNGDGKVDIIIGAPFFDNGSKINCGKIYVYSSADNSLIFSIMGENSGDQLGMDVSGLEDYNGDGKNDILFSAPFYDGSGKTDNGKIYVYSGANNSLITTKQGENSNDHFGLNVSDAGDINGDGKGDILISAPQFDGAVGVDSGKIYAYSGTDNSQLFTKEGESTEDHFGIGLSNAGDINGDGKNDVIVGAPNYDGNAGADSGKIYIYSGNDASLVDSTEGENAGDLFGISVSSAGDYNNDGKDDVIVGAPRFDGANGNNSGKIYVYSGSNNTLLATGVGENAEDLLGTSVSGGGDHDYDGNSDVLAGAPSFDNGIINDAGKLYVYKGIGQEFTSGGNTIGTKEGVNDNEQMGQGIANAGDINRDGKNDIIIGSPFFDGTGKNNCGKVYLVSGADHSNIHTIEGENAEDQFGYAVATAGDYNRDGKTDIIVGAPFYDGAAGADTGKIYVYSGADWSLLFSMEGQTAGDNFGSSVNNAGDYNSDGKGDVIIGAPNFGANDKGKIYIYSGANNSLLFSQEGEVNDDNFGLSVSSAKDYNIDGKDDVIVGAPSYDGAAGADTGKIYIYSGSDNSILYSKEGEAANDNFGSSISSAGDYNGDGRHDVIVGAPNNDGVAGSNTGKIYIYSGKDDSVLYSKEGEASGDLFGSSVSSAGDYNGDGKHDVIVGAPNNDGVAGSNTGKIYIYSGQDNSVLYSKEGEAANDNLGTQVSTAGDFNNDGKYEVLYSAPNNDDEGKTDSGKVYIVAIDNSIVITITRKAGQANLTGTLPVSFTVSFSKAIDPITFTSDDIIQTGTATGVNWEIVNSGDNKTFTLNATTVTNSGTLLPKILQEKIQDTLGNKNQSTVGQKVVVDITPPSVTIELASGQNSNDLAPPINFTITFSEAIATPSFTAADIIQNGTATGITWIITDSGDQKTFNLSANTVTGEGTVIPTVSEGGIQDLSGNDNSSSNASATVNYQANEDVLYLSGNGGSTLNGILIDTPGLTFKNGDPVPTCAGGNACKSTKPFVITSDRQFAQVTLENGAYLTGGAWSSGTPDINNGILQFSVIEDLAVCATCQISMAGRGFKGGTTSRYQGYFSSGTPTNSRLANGQSGGGGDRYCYYSCTGGSAGGGGHATSGQNGGGNSGYWGRGGSAAGSTDLSAMTIGGGGGAGYNSQGGKGGGAIKITTNNLINNGTITAKGANGGNSSSYSCGGGGAGGSIYLIVNGTYNNTSGTITADKGNGGTNCGYGIGGNGSFGRIRLDLPNITSAPIRGVIPGAYITMPNNIPLSSDGVAVYLPSVTSAQGVALSNSASLTTDQANFLVNGDFSATSSSITANNSMTINGNLSANGSSFTASNTLALTGGISLDNSSTLTVSSTLTASQSVTLDNNSTINAGGSSQFGESLTLATNSKIYGFAWSSGAPSFGNGIMELNVTDTLTICSNCQISMAGRGFKGGTTSRYQGYFSSGTPANSRLANGQSGGGGDRYCYYGCSGGSAGGGGHATSGQNGSGNSGRWGRGGSAAGSTDLSAMTIGGGGGAGYNSQGGKGGGAIKITTNNLINNGTITAKGANGGNSSSYSCGGGGAGGSIYLIVNGTYNNTSGTITADKGNGGTNCGYGIGGNGSFGRIRLDLPNITSAPIRGVIPGAYITMPNNIPLSSDGVAVYLPSVTSAQGITLSNSASLTLDQANFVVNGNFSVTSSSITTNSSITINGSLSVNGSSFTANNTLALTGGISLDNSSTLTVSSTLTASQSVTLDNNSTLNTGGLSQFGESLTLATNSKIYGFAWSSGAPSFGNGIIELSVNDTLTICSDCKISMAGRGFKGGTTAQFQGHYSSGTPADSRSANGQSGGGGRRYCYFSTCSGGSAGGGGHATSGQNGTGNTGYWGTKGSAAGSSDLSTMTIGGGGGSGYTALSGGNGGGAIKITINNLINNGTITTKGSNGAGSIYTCGGGGAGGSIHLIVNGTYNNTNGTITADKGLGGTGCSFGVGGNGSVGRIRLDLPNITSAPIRGVIPGAYITMPNNIPLSSDGVAIYLPLVTSAQEITLSNSASLTTDQANFAVNGNLSVTSSSITANNSMTINGNLSANGSSFTANNTLALTGEISLDNSSALTVSSTLTASQSVTLDNNSTLTTGGLSQFGEDLTLATNSKIYGFAWSSGTPSFGNGIMELDVTDTLTICSDCQISMAGRGFKGGTTAQFQGHYSSGTPADSRSANGQSGGGGKRYCYFSTCSGGSAGGGGHATSGQNGTGNTGYWGRGGSAEGDTELTDPTIGGGGGAGYTVLGGNGGGAIKISMNNLMNNGTITAKGSNGAGSSYTCGGGGAGGSIYLHANSDLTNNGTITADKGAAGTSCTYGTAGNGSVGRIRLQFDSSTLGTITPTVGFCNGYEGPCL